MAIRRRLNMTRTSQSTRRLVLPAIALVIVFSASLYFGNIRLDPESSQPDTHAPSETVPTNYSSIVKAIAAHASFKHDDIVIAYVDSAFVDMALNFHDTSLPRLGIKNFLFVSSDHACCRRLQEASIPCYVHKLDKASGVASRYGSPDFIRKMNYRTEVILTALEHGYTVLHTDTDVVFMRDPFIYLRPLACDIAIMVEKPGIFNAGFVYVRPTPAGIATYRRMRSLAEKSPTVDDQIQLNAVITSLKATIQVIPLPMSLFSSGLIYFEAPDRVFFKLSDTRSEHYVIHNNWIVSKEAKVYRFKEHLMWMLDDGEYYTSKLRRYLTYDNPPLHPGSFQSVSVDVQLGALRSALAIGRTLNRTVILPAFHCPLRRPCALNSIMRVSAFDAAFGGAYREHVFLQHLTVPESVKKSRSNTILILSEAADAVLSLANKTAPNQTAPILFRPIDRKSGASSLEITTWFQDMNESVLCFQSLYGAFGSFADTTEQMNFEKSIRVGFRPAGYRQY